MRSPRRPLLVLLLLAVATLTGCEPFSGLSPAAGSQPPPAGALVVSFIDVGQGDAVLVQSGGKNYLVDAGKPQEGPNVVDFLRSRGVETLDGIVVSNPDADHIGGFLDVLDAYEVPTVYLSGDPKGTATYNSFLRGVQDEGSVVEESRDGDVYDWGGTQAAVLSPPPDEFFSETNDNSVGILLTFGTARVLLAGDAEKKGEEYMSSGSHTGPLALLKVTHHGSNTSSTPLFLSRFKPKIAVIQVGEDNSYGHPTPQTLRRLQTVGAKVFRNDEHGDVIVTIEDNKADVAVTKP